MKTGIIMATGSPELNLYASVFQNIAILIMMVFLYNFIPDRIYLYKKTRSELSRELSLVSLLPQDL